jgi:hypothetical protein
LEDLIKESKLVNKDYGIIHFDSPDKRGIDVYCIKIFPPYHLQQYTFDRISRKPTKALTKMEVATEQMITWKTDQNNRVFTGTFWLPVFWMGGNNILSTTGLLVLGAKKI